MDPEKSSFVFIQYSYPMKTCEKTPEGTRSRLLCPGSPRCLFTGKSSSRERSRVESLHNTSHEHPC